MVYTWPSIHKCVDFVGRTSDDLSWRAFLFSLTRHRSTTEAAHATYELRSCEEWLNITRGQLLERKVNTKTQTLTEHYILVDPSDDLSFEEIARPSARSQALHGEDDLKGLGCGNVARVTASKYVGSLGAKMTYTRLGYHPGRVRKACYFVLLCSIFNVPQFVQGALKSQHTMRLRLVNMETVVTRGDTPEESSVAHIFSPGVEKDAVLLHGWNRDLGKQIDPIKKLDAVHLLWYKINQTGQILCMFQHFNLDPFDEKIFVSSTL